MPGYAGDKERVLTRLRRIEGQRAAVTPRWSWPRPPTPSPGWFEPDALR